MTDETAPTSAELDAHLADTLGGPREQLRRFSRKVVLAAGRYYVDHGVGFDPEANALGKPPWWGRCDMLGGRAVQSILVRDCLTGIEAMEKLGDEVAARVKAVERKRRHRR